MNILRIVLSSSALEVHDAAELDSASKISFDQHGANFRLPPLDKYRRRFKHVFVSRTNALFDGYRYGLFARKRITFTHYSGPGSPPFPEIKKRFMLCTILASTIVILLLSAQIMWRYLCVCGVRVSSSVLCGHEGSGRSEFSKLTDGQGVLGKV